MLGSCMAKLLGNATGHQFIKRAENGQQESRKTKQVRPNWVILIISFVDFKKAFETIQGQSLINNTRESNGGKFIPAIKMQFDDEWRLF